LLKSSGNLSTGALSSLNAKVNAQSLAGAVSITSSKSKTALLATSKTGMSIGTYDVSGGTVSLNAGAAFTGTTGTATGNITLDAVGAASVGNVASSAGIVDLESSASTLTTGTVSGASGILLKSSGNLGTGALTSLNANVNAQSLAGAVSITSSKSKTTLLATSKTGMSIGNYDVSGGTVSLNAGAAFTGTTGTATGNITLDAVGSASVGNVASSAGIVDLESSASTLTTGTVLGASGVLLKSSGNLGTASLTSLNAGVSGESLTGSVSISAVNAKTSLVAKSMATMTLNTFTVSNGGASLNAGTDFTSVNGTAYGPITVTMKGVGTLGSLTSTTGAISATSTLKGMSFNALKAATGITLLAKANMGLGLNPAYALFGTSLDAGTGAVDAQTTTGNVQTGKLTAKLTSTLKSTDGNLKINAIALPALVTLNATTSGTKSLPAGY
jgi:hypothetical protein